MDPFSISQKILLSKVNKSPEQLYIAPGFGKSIICCELIKRGILIYDNVYYITSRRILIEDVARKLSIPLNKKKVIISDTNIDVNWIFSEIKEFSNNQLNFQCYQSLENLLNKKINNNLFIFDESHNIIKLFYNNDVFFKNLKLLTTNNKCVFLTATPISRISNKLNFIKFGMDDETVFGKVSFNISYKSAKQLETANENINIKYPKFEIFRWVSSSILLENEEYINDNLSIEKEIELLSANLIKTINEINKESTITLLIVRSQFDLIYFYNYLQHSNFSIICVCSEKIINGFEIPDKNYGKSKQDLLKFYLSNKVKNIIVLSVNMLIEGFDFPLFDNLFILRSLTLIKTIQAVFRLIRKSSTHNILKRIYIPKIINNNNSQLSVYDKMYEQITNYISQDNISILVLNNLEINEDQQNNIATKNNISYKEIPICEHTLNNIKYNTYTFVENEKNNKLTNLLLNNYDSIFKVWDILLLEHGDNSFHFIKNIKTHCEDFLSCNKDDQENVIKTLYIIVDSQIQNKDNKILIKNVLYEILINKSKIKHNNYKIILTLLKKIKDNISNIFSGLYKISNNQSAYIFLKILDSNKYLPWDLESYIQKLLSTNNVNDIFVSTNIYDKQLDIPKKNINIKNNNLSSDNLKSYSSLNIHGITSSKFSIVIYSDDFQKILHSTSVVIPNNNIFIENSTYYLIVQDIKLEISKKIYSFLLNKSGSYKLANELLELLIDIDIEIICNNVKYRMSKITCKKKIEISKVLINNCIILHELN